MQRGVLMNLSVKNEKNLAFMIEKIVDKLQMINASAIKAEHYSIDCYEELYNLYALVESKQQFSVSEIEAIIAELGHLRKKQSL